MIVNINNYMVILRLYAGGKKSLYKNSLNKKGLFRGLICIEKIKNFHRKKLSFLRQS